MKINCPNCNGTGICPQCEGNGWVETFTWWYKTHETCPDCNDPSEPIYGICQFCKGTGYFEIEPEDLYSEPIYVH